MPVYESYGRARSNLTREQKREAEAAIYGLQETIMSSPQMSPQEIERMREILAAHDRQNKGVQEFDLNNPPKQPYVHQEFPKAMYHHAKRKNALVHDEKQMREHEERGFSAKPFPVEDVQEEPELDEEDAREAAAVDAQIENLRKKAAKAKAKPEAKPAE